MNEFARCLVELDAPAARKIWKQVQPNALQPATDGHMLIMLHRARTETPTIDKKLRLYSHFWLEDRGLPSGLPPEERPQIVDAVGVSFKFSSPSLQPAAKLIHSAITDAIEVAYADGRKEPAFVRARMAEARAKETKKLFGRWSLP